MSRKPSPFDPLTTYAHGRDGGDAARMPLTPSFWQELMSGEAQSDDVKRVASEAGWLFGASRLDDDTKTWEMHPEGDEILYLLSGEVDVVFETPEGELVVGLRPGKACVVPKGVWHKQVVRSPGDELFFTYGRGTEHKPV